MESPPDDPVFKRVFVKGGGGLSLSISGGYPSPAPKKEEGTPSPPVIGQEGYPPPLRNRKWGQKSLTY